MTRSSWFRVGRCTIRGTDAGCVAILIKGEDNRFFYSSGNGKEQCQNDSGCVTAMCESLEGSEQAGD